ncbi:unnamed protein product [Echinostoma caproni]|uniref:Activating molecule in BECN1-regulated autophagy protein 1 n=1 Tax=Echinostoma caproni TaxID=27848 RepID=A0A183AIQ4_9TREM|nr:unnamed protein product [Echinostoma caproni]
MLLYDQASQITSAEEALLTAFSWRCFPTKFHPSQPHLLASGCLGGSIRLWNLECLINVDGNNLSEPRQLSCTSVWKHSGAIASLAFHPTHPILVAAWSQEVVFYDWVSGRKLSVWRFVSNHSRVRWVRFSPDGFLLYTATANPSGQSQLSEDQENQAQNSSNNSSGLPTTNSSACGRECDDIQPQTIGIPRDALLQFLVSRPDSWFQQLGVCSACSVRLCRWAGTLGPEFPSPKVDLYRGVTTVSRVAQAVASSLRLTGLPLSHVVQELLPVDPSEPPSDTAHCLLNDANPAAVAIIEDMPVREFLMSRGNYCSSPSTVIGKGGVCCGGHACDLVLAHRDLMRHSICRPCLAAFWRWTSQHVAWWRWSRHLVENTPLARSETGSFAQSTLRRDPVSVTKFLQNTNHSVITDVPESQTAVGICIRCRARTNISTKDVHRAPPSSSKESTVDSPSSDVSKRCIPVAALELLQSRLGNANDVTQVTYMASELITEGVISGRIADLLRVEPFVKTKISLPESFLYLLQQATLVRRVPTVGRELKSVEAPDLFESRQRGLAEQAASIGQFMMSTPDQAWNRPCCAEVVSPPCAEVEAPLRLELFPYVPTGSRLLRPTVSTRTESHVPECVQMDSRSSKPSVVLRNRSEDSLRVFEQSADVDPLNGRSMTACCRCGHIVPQTFPIDPQSNLSAVVCEKLVLSEDQCHSTNALPNRHHAFPRRRPHSPHEPHTAAIPVGSCRPNKPYSQMTDDSLPSRLANQMITSDVTGTPSETPSSSQTSIQSLHSGNMFQLINHTNTDSVMHAVNRSITEVIAGLFVNMGEHGSASSLQETTYRVCRWELNLCGPIQADCARCSPRKSSHPVAPEDPSSPRSFLPMPANVAVSYNTNSLVIPHARLFNDSSICLSPDGRMLAAFVTPCSTSDRVSDLRHGDRSATNMDSSASSLDTMLAVYRLQPRSRRGQCLFAHRFRTCTPVCLDFSPLSDYLAVGMATSRLPSAALPTSSIRRMTGSGMIVDAAGSQGDLLDVQSLRSTTRDEAVQSNAPDSTLLPMRHAFVARIFRLERIAQDIGTRCTTSPVVRRLKEIVSIQHPGMSIPVSSSSLQSSNQPVLNSLPSRWHRLLLSSPAGISLNTIVWNPHGGLFYGTTKGLVVLMQSEPDAFSHKMDFTPGVSAVLSAPDVDYEQDNAHTSSRTKHGISSVHRLTCGSGRFVRLAHPDSSSL